MGLEGWLVKKFQAERPDMLRIYTIGKTASKGGKKERAWRWCALKDGVAVAYGPLAGHSSSREAEKAAVSCIKFKHDYTVRLETE